MWINPDLTDINWIRIEPAVLSSTAGQKQSGLDIRLRRHIYIQNKKKYIDERSNFVIISKRIMNEF